MAGKNNGRYLLTTGYSNNKFLMEFNLTFPSTFLETLFLNCRWIILWLLHSNPVLLRLLISIDLQKVKLFKVFAQFLYVRSEKRYT